MATISVTGFVQRHLNAGAAVGLTALLVNPDNQQGQARIFLGARAGLGLAVDPVVIAAGGDFQSLAQRANGMLGFHRVNPLKTLEGGSDRMPKVFLKCHAAAADNRSHAADRHFRTPIVRRFAPPRPSPLGAAARSASSRLRAFGDQSPTLRPLPWPLCRC